MILVDMNQVTLSNLMVQIGGRKEVEPDLVRHMVLNSLRGYRRKFSDEYGELVICCDSKHYWRRDYFPNYKVNRKKDREATGHDWDTIFNCLHAIRDDLVEHFPYKVVEVYGAEADDIIATLVRYVKTNRKHLILSSDKDFIQLHNNNVDQFSPVSKKLVNGKDPKTYLQEHILKGDRSDGVPNVLSADDTFVVDKRQKPLRKTTISTVMEAMKDHEAIDLHNLAKCPKDTWIRNYQRNQTLIDLGFIPDELMAEINMAYNNAKVGERSQLLNYFIENRLTQLIDNVGDF